MGDDECKRKRLQYIDYVSHTLVFKIDLLSRCVDERNLMRIIDNKIKHTVPVRKIFPFFVVF